MLVRPFVLAGAVLAGSGLQAAPDSDIPEAEFLEYLGFWEGSDEDWLLFSEATGDEKDDERDSAAERAAATENDDED